MLVVKVAVGLAIISVRPRAALRPNGANALAPTAARSAAAGRIKRLQQRHAQTCLRATPTGRKQLSKAAG
eukprot:5114593-Alexandrium_andersonii.AAC.1